MNDQTSCLCTRVIMYVYREYQWAHLRGFNPVVLLHGFHRIIICINTSNDSRAKDNVPDVPFLNLLPFPAKLNYLVHGSSKSLLTALPKGQQPLTSVCPDPACSRSPWCYRDKEVSMLWTAGACCPCSTKETWWLPVLKYRFWSIQQVWDDRRV